MQLEIITETMKITAENRKYIYIGAAVVAALVLALVVFSIYTQTEMAQVKKQNEMLQLANEQLSLAGEYDQLSTEFQNYETQTKFLSNDSLIIKYGEAKDKVEKLLTELKTQKITSEKRIKELKNEIATLKNILRHYVEQIDTLNKENAGLRAENKEIKDQNKRLSSKVSEVSKANEELSERMTLAEKLNVTGLSLTSIKSSGKVEKKLKKAKQLLVQFTLPQNNSTPVGEKTIYMRITNPEGSLLGGNGSFEFEGSKLPYTELKTIEYTGEEIAGIKIYWNINTTLTAGDYRVELFADSFRIASRTFTLGK